MHSLQRSAWISLSTRVFLFSSLLVISSSALAEVTASFQGLGELSGGSFYSAALGISADGKVAVGLSSGSYFEAFRWTQAGGMVGIGRLPGSTLFSSAQDASSDGSVVVGNSGSTLGNQAFRWTTGGMTGLSDLPGGVFDSSALGVSADGSVVVGRGTSASGTEAFRWTQAGGMVGLGDLAGGSFNSYANSASANGSVIVGTGASASGTEAFRWTQAGGMVGLGDLSGGTFSSQANAVSADGTVVVGLGTSAAGQEAFRWTQGGGIQSLGDLSGGTVSSTAAAVSKNGSIVAGYGTSGVGSEAMIWRSSTGMVTLQSVLTEYGVGIGDFSQLLQITGLGEDQNSITFAGQGISTLGNQAFVATLPFLSASLADEVVTLTPGLTGDELVLDVSQTKVLIGDVLRYEFDFTSDGVYDLTLDSGTPLFNNYWDPLSHSFRFAESLPGAGNDFNDFYSALPYAIYTTKIRMTLDNNAVDTSTAQVSFVPEPSPALLCGAAILACAAVSRLRLRRTVVAVRSRD